MTSPSRTDWSARLQQVSDAAAPSPTRPLYDEANIDAIRAALAGLGPDAAAGAVAAPGIGACMVANISSAHVPSVCRASRRGDERPYKNGYDLGKYRIGGNPPNGAKALREVVDEALPLPDGSTGADVYFGAMELNGTGVYFYGDVCLVLKDVAEATVMLDRNSYDLVRTPLRNGIEAGCPEEDWPARRKAEAFRISGTWGGSRDAIAGLKVFEGLGRRNRRFTTGEISDALRVDEDYVEILKVGSFGTGDLAEARLSAADAALDASIEDRRRSGPPPTAEARLWRGRRRVAERELQNHSVPVRVVTTSGRIKG